MSTTTSTESVRLLALLAALLALTGCSSSSRPATPTIGSARTYELSGFRPLRVARPGPARLAFTITQPSGAPLTAYRAGGGPHTGVHVIVVRDDLALIIHRHPPVRPDGRVVQPIDFPTPGRYRVLVDAFPAIEGGPRNFQLHTDVGVAGRYRPQALPQFDPLVTARGYRISLKAPRVLRAIEPAFLTVAITAPDGRPASFTPYYGALAHAIFFRAGSLDYFHTHVCGPSTPGCTSALGGASVVGRPTSPGKIRVGLLLPVAGSWRLFLQFQTGGRVLTAPFTLRVR
ncbi:MAG TPA: hypothetical protein VK287_01825 [Gaiellaceae bacterium]|nr:hypothetical protein [Gaiellaceae bacterium]